MKLNNEQPIAVRFEMTKDFMLRQRYLAAETAITTTVTGNTKFMSFTYMRNYATKGTLQY